MCWVIVRTKIHGTCEWDHLWNETWHRCPHWLKSFFAHSINHSNMGCGVHFPHIMTKLKKDENFASLIWASKVSYIVKIGQDFHLKRTVKRRSFELWITMNWKWFMADKFHHIQFSLQICIVLQTCVFQTIPLVCVYVHFKIRCTTEEVFIVDSMKIILANWQLYT